MKQLLYFKDGFAIHLVPYNKARNRGQGIDLYRCGDYSFASRRMNAAGISIMTTLFKKKLGYEVSAEHKTHPLTSAVNAAKNQTVFRIMDKKSQFEFILKYGPFVDK